MYGYLELRKGLFEWQRYFFQFDAATKLLSYSTDPKSEPVGQISLETARIREGSGKRLYIRCGANSTGNKKEWELKASDAFSRQDWAQELRKTCSVEVDSSPATSPLSPCTHSNVQFESLITIHEYEVNPTNQSASQPRSPLRQNAKEEEQQHITALAEALRKRTVAFESASDNKVTMTGYGAGQGSLPVALDSLMGMLTDNGEMASRQPGFEAEEEDRMTAPAWFGQSHVVTRTEPTNFTSGGKRKLLKNGSKVGVEGMAAAVSPTAESPLVIPAHDRGWYPVPTTASNTPNTVDEVEAVF